MIFEEYSKHAYTVKELSFSQAEAMYEQQLYEQQLYDQQLQIDSGSDTAESFAQLFNNSYSYRTHLDLSRLTNKL